MPIDKVRTRCIFTNYTLSPDGRSFKRVERTGQEQVVNQTERCQLPTDGLREPDVASKFGIEIHGPTPGDEIWTDVTLPAGWRFVPTDSSYWTNLLDGAGHRRARIFYKSTSTFRGRSATILWVTRYRSSYIADDLGDFEGKVYGVVYDGDTQIWCGPGVVDDGRLITANRAQQQAIEWLEDNYPNHLDHTAYWDD